MLLYALPFGYSCDTDGAMPLEAPGYTDVAMYLSDMCHICLSFTSSIFVLRPLWFG